MVILRLFISVFIAYLINQFLGGYLLNLVSFIPFGAIILPPLIVAILSVILFEILKRFIRF